MRVWARLYDDECTVVCDNFKDQGEWLTDTISRQSALELVAHILECTLERSNGHYELY